MQTAEIKLAPFAAEEAGRDSIEWPCYLVGEFFAVHREITSYTRGCLKDGRKIPSCYRWSVTHLPSGMRAGGCQLLKDGREMARELDTIPGGKWASKDPGKAMSRRAFRKCSEIVAKYR